MAKKKELMDITIVLDRSGSMGGIKADAEGGLRAFVDEQKKTIANAKFTLVQFDTEYEVVYDAVPLKKVGKISLLPRGCTALLDAMGKTIISTTERLEALTKSKRPSKVLFVVVTDGLENSSVEYKKDQVSALIKEREEDWQFVFLAANQDAIQEGQQYGITRGSSMTYAATGQGIGQAFDALSHSTGCFYMSAGPTVDCFFSEDARDAQDALLDKEEDNG
jgi:uncharacterized protein YegL